MKRLKYFSSFNEDHLEDFQPRTTERMNNKNHVFKIKAKDGYYRLEILADRDKFKLWVPFADDAISGKYKDLDNREEFYKALGHGEILPWILGAFKRLAALKEQEEFTTPFQSITAEDVTYKFAIKNDGTIDVLFPMKIVQTMPEDLYLQIPELMVLPVLNAKLRDELEAHGITLPDPPYSEVLRAKEIRSDE